MLPIAPPTDCNANTNATDQPVVSAVDNCTLPKVKFDTVLEPVKNAPTAPRKEEKSVQSLPVTSAKVRPMIFTMECSPPTNIKFTITNAPIKAINGFFDCFKLDEKISLTFAPDTPNIGIAINTVIINGINAGT